MLKGNVIQSFTVHYKDEILRERRALTLCDPVGVALEL